MYFTQWRTNCLSSFTLHLFHGRFPSSPVQSMIHLSPMSSPSGKTCQTATFTDLGVDSLGFPYKPPYRDQGPLKLGSFSLVSLLVSLPMVSLLQGFVKRLVSLAYFLDCILFVMRRWRSKFSHALVLYPPRNRLRRNTVK